jgi:hypothetical protein
LEQPELLEQLETQVLVGMGAMVARLLLVAL